MLKLILSSKVRKVTIELGRFTKSLNRVRAVYRVTSCWVRFPRSVLDVESFVNAYKRRRIEEKRCG
jgi:hypothetical protein